VHAVLLLIFIIKIIGWDQKCLALPGRRLVLLVVVGRLEAEVILLLTPLS
jgi:hypothetical protein